MSYWLVTFAHSTSYIVPFSTHYFAGVKMVTLLDDTPTKYEDLSAQFYLDESSIGIGRAQVSHAKLAELNPYVQVSLFSGQLLEQDLLKFTAVVLIDQELSYQLRVAEFCHKNNIAVLVGDVFGVFGSIFCDFGENFEVHDTNGEQAASSMIAGITQDFPALVTVLEEARHNLESGDVVMLTELIGMEQLNGREFVVSVKDPFSFEINEDTRGYRPYERGGYSNQIKQKVSLSFKSMAESIEDPNNFVCDVMKFDRMSALHIAFRYPPPQPQQHEKSKPSQRLNAFFGPDYSLS